MKQSEPSEPLARSSDRQIPSQRHSEIWQYHATFREPPPCGENSGFGDGAAHRLVSKEVKSGESEGSVIKDWEAGWGRHPLRMDMPRRPRTLLSRRQAPLPIWGVGKPGNGDR